MAISPDRVASASSGSETAADMAPYGATLALLTTAFFMVGFTTVLNDILVPHLKSVFALDYTQSLLVQFAFYLGYLAISFPAARLIATIGYKSAVIAGLLGMAAACLLFVPASMLLSYGVFLFALFALAAACTLLQVAINPYVTVVGPPATASSRLTLVQAFNSLGTTLAPIFGGLLILRHDSSVTSSGNMQAVAAGRIADAHAVQLPYVLIALVLCGFAALVWRSHLPRIDQQTRARATSGGTATSVWRHRNLTFGVIAVLIYMICEIGIGSTLVSFISQPQVGNMSHAAASGYVALFWGGMMVGRFIGAVIMQFVAPRTTLAVTSVCACLLAVCAALGAGHFAMWSLVLVGLFQSIMFPTIFTLGIEGLGSRTEEAGGFLIMAIAGGGAAVIQGVIADHVGLSLSYLLPAAGYVFMLFYALWGSKPVFMGTGQWGATKAEQERVTEPQARS